MRRRLGQTWKRIAAASQPQQLSPLFLLFAFGVGALAWAWHHLGIPWSLESGDAYEYAEMARRLARGEGFTTGIIYPAELWLGAGPDHPAVKFPPLWPAILAGPFALFGAHDRVVHAVVGLLFATLVAVSAALATRLAGRGAGACTAIAVASTPLLLALSLDGVSEIPFALAVTTVFLLCTTPERAGEKRPDGRALAGAIGLACGLAYLIRYNGAVLLPVALGLLAVRRVPARSLRVCAGCFLLVALPWWIRNWVVTGDPVYSLLNLNLYFAPVMTRLGGSLFFQLEPDLSVAAAADPLEKALVQLPLLLRQLPFASVNLAAFLGVLLACWRRDAVSIGLACCAVATLVVVAFALAMGRYFAPFFPPMIALGVAGWFRYGGRWRTPALAALLLAPLLPSLPTELPDVALIRAWVAETREREVERATDAKERACLADQPRVIAQQAARLVWRHDLVAIYAPSKPDVIQRIAAEHPVTLAQLPDPRRVPGERFTPREDCGAGWYGVSPRL